MDYSKQAAERQIAEAGRYTLEEWDRLCDQLDPKPELRPARFSPWSDPFLFDRRLAPALSQQRARDQYVVHLPRWVMGRLGI